MRQSGRMLETDKRTEDGLFVAGWCVIAGAGLLLLFARIAGVSPLRALAPCMLHALTGIYCPGCGGTRAVCALLDGRLLRSLWYHPFVLYAAGIGTWFMVSQTIERVSGGKIRIGMHYREIYMWIALAVIVVNFIVKNTALLVFHIDLLA